MPGVCTGGGAASGRMGTRAAVLCAALVVATLTASLAFRMNSGPGRPTTSSSIGGPSTARVSPAQRPVFQDPALRRADGQVETPRAGGVEGDDGGESTPRVTFGEDGSSTPQRAPGPQRLDWAAPEPMLQDPHRVLPEPRGPASGESVSDYVKRILRQIRLRDGDQAEAAERTGLELELEAYMKGHAEAAEALVDLVRGAEDVRTAEIALILLGRCSHRNGVDFLVQVARGQPELEARFPHGDHTVELNGMVYTIGSAPLAVSAVLALFQSGGKTGPLPPPYGFARVDSKPTSVDDPYIFLKLVELMGDQATPRDVRVAILAEMQRNLPDPPRGRMGDFPRPTSVAPIAESALDIVRHLANSSGDQAIENAARQALATVRRPEILRELSDIAYQEKDEWRRANALGALAASAGDPGIRHRLIQELQDSPSGAVREHIISGVPFAALLGDPRLLQAFLDCVSHDPHWPVQVRAMDKLFASGDRQVVGRCLSTLQTMPIEQLDEPLRADMMRAAKRIADEEGGAEDNRRIADQIVQRLAR